MSPTHPDPRRMIAKALLHTHDTANQARGALTQLRAHLGHIDALSGPAEMISAQLAATVSEYQAKRNACAEMCLAIGASQAQVDLALGDDSDAFYDLYDAMRGTA